MCFSVSSRRRHTRSTRDWSSDVCSSDLTTTVSSVNKELERVDGMMESAGNIVRSAERVTSVVRSEERRVGKECRSRWSPNEYKETTVKRGRGWNMTSAWNVKTRLETADA